MISCLTELGRLGMTAVGDSPEEARSIYERAEAVLLEESEAALTETAI